MRSKILSVGSYLPPRVVTNEDLSTLMDTSDEWIVQRTGIKTRHWVEGAVGVSDLALKASQDALKKAGLQANQIDMIILATLSPDHDFPGSACFLQAKLGVPGVPALDIRQQCSGFLYGMSIADQFIRSGQYKNILLVGAEVHSKGLDKTTRGRDVAVLFGDGAGAAIISACDPKSESESQIFSTHLYADGNFAKELWLPGPSNAMEGERMTHEMVDAGDIYPKMNGKAVFVNAVKRMPEAILKALEMNGKTAADVDLFIFHQANLRINEMVAKQMGVPDDKVFNTIEKFANTTAATIPIGLCEAEKAGKLKKGMLVASAAFGAGFTWASALYRW